MDNTDRFIEPKSVLVTGCAGFIGGNFVKRMLEEYPNTVIVGIDDFSTGRKTALSEKIIFYEGSVLEDPLLEMIFSKHEPQYVFHFAALPRVAFAIEQPVLTSEVNIIGTVALLNKARMHNVNRFIYSSSSSIYGGAKILPTKEDENPPSPKSPYAIQKFTGEPFCQCFSELLGLDTVCLRYFNVFGPGQYGDSAYSTVVSAWLESLYFPDQKKGFIEGDGSKTRDLCFIENVISANLLAMKAKRKLGGVALNIASGTRTSMNEIRTLIESHAGKKLNLEARPDRLGDVFHTHADVTKAKDWIDYKPLVLFEEGLKKTIGWFEERAQSEK